MDLSLRAREHTVSVVAGKDVIPRLCYAAVRRLLRRLNQVAPSQPMMKAFSSLLGGRDKGYSPRAAARRRSAESGRASIAEDAADPSPASPVSKDVRNDHPPEPEGARLAPLHDFEQKPPPPPPPPTRPPAVKTERLKRHVSDDLTTPASEARCQGHWEDLEGTQGLELRDHGAVDFLVQPGVVVHLRHLTSENGPTAEVRHPTAFTEIPMSSRMMLDHVPSVYQAAIDAVIAKEEEAVAARARAAAEAKREVREFGPGGYAVYARAAARLDRRARRARRRPRPRSGGPVPANGGDAVDGDEGVLSPATTPTNKGVAADDNPFVSGLARMGSLIARPFRTKDDSRRSSPRAAARAWTVSPTGARASGLTRSPTTIFTAPPTCGSGTKPRSSPGPRRRRWTRRRNHGRRRRVKAIERLRGTRGRTRSCSAWVLCLVRSSGTRERCSAAAETWNPRWRCWEAAAVTTRWRTRDT